MLTGCILHIDASSSYLVGRLACSALLQVVITGSSRGLGLALADKFLSFGDDVVITSRSEGSCQEVAAQLRSKYPDRRVLSYPCDVQNPVETEALADFAARELGSIDIWVNNAGVSQAEKAKLSDVQPEKIQDIIGTNLLGSMFGSRAAIRVMQKQPSGGKVRTELSALNFEST